jgi:hypothetical protein
MSGFFSCVVLRHGFVSFSRKQYSDSAKQCADKERTFTGDLAAMILMFKNDNK